jgi:hypothetical protein
MRSNSQDTVREEIIIDEGKEKPLLCTLRKNMCTGNNQMLEADRERACTTRLGPSEKGYNVVIGNLGCMSQY